MDGHDQTECTVTLARNTQQWVAAQMGHTDWTFTARTYTRYIPDDAPDAGSKLAQADQGWRQAANRRN